MLGARIWLTTLSFAQNGLSALCFARLALVGPESFSAFKGLGRGVWTGLPAISSSIVFFLKRKVWKSSASFTAQWISQYFLVGNSCPSLVVIGVAGFGDTPALF